MCKDDSADSHSVPPRLGDAIAATASTRPSGGEALMGPGLFATRAGYIMRSWSGRGNSSSEISVPSPKTGIEGVELKIRE